MCIVIRCPMCGRALERQETKRNYVFKCDCGTVVRIPKRIFNFYEDFCRDVKGGDSDGDD